MRRQLVHIVNSTPSLKKLAEEHLEKGQGLTEELGTLEPSDSQLSKIRYV